MPLLIEAQRQGMLRMRGMGRDKTRKDLNEKVTLELPALSIIASSWEEKDRHGDVVEDGWLG